MKKLICTFIVFVLGTGLLCAQNNFINTHILDQYNPNYVKGEVLIKFKEEAQIVLSITNGIAKTGLSSVDRILEPYQVKKINKVFKETREERNLKTTRTIRTYKGEEKEVPALFNIFKIEVDTIWNIMQIVEELQQDENIEFVEPNYYFYTMEMLDKSSGIRHPVSGIRIESTVFSLQPPVPSPGSPPSPTVTPNDPLYSQQWYLPAVNAPAAWDSTTSDSSQVIAIIDTGVDWDHPDLDGNIWTNWNEVPGNGTDDDGNGYVDDIRGWDWVNNDNDPNDDNSHGTHVAGIAAAESNNSVGIAGMAWNARLMPLKMLQSSGSGSSSNLATAIEYATANGATILNMSLGSYANSGTVENALINAYVNSVLVAAAGNDSRCICNDCPQCATMFPAGYPFVLGVQCEGSFSNNDPSGPIDFVSAPIWNYELTAPGVNIMSTIPNGYRSYNGTSMATPIVSGICALAKSHCDTLYTDFLWAKLIFGSENGYVNAYNTLILDLDSIGPDLRFLQYTLTDTLPGCDRDGRADAGETIQLHFTVKNVGGYADSAWVNLHFGEFEDTTTATINDSTSYIGDLSTWATLTSELSPIEITIDSNVAHNRDIVFEYNIGCDNGDDTITNDLIINVERGIELSGVVLEDDTLHSEYLYLVNESYRIGSGVTLYIEPGTEIQIYPGLDIDVRGKVMAIGTEDSLIWVHPKSSSASGFMHNYGGGNSEFKYCKFNSLGQALDGDQGQGGGGIALVEYCIFEECGYNDDISTFRNNIVRNSSGRILYRANTVEYNNFYNWSSGGSWYYLPTSTMNYNNFFGPNMIVGITSGNWSNYGNSFVSLSNGGLSLSGSADVLNIPNQFWGGTNNEEIERIIYDFWDNNNLPIANTIPILSQPSPLNHGHIWKVELNGINPFDETLDPLGSETVKFDVFFNRAMDTVYAPLVGFGVFEPYLQRIISDSAHWNSDSTIWTAYHTIGPETGDGINTVHVRNAKDPEGFEIPPEKFRFKFVIQAASAASIQFIATPGIGKVDLEWPPANTPDVLGYNLYRKYNLTDTTFSPLVRINEELILDTTCVDYDVIPDTTYNYYYTIVGTDLAESDYSKKVTAKPFSAANGDANGDLVVNVLDITTVIAYMLNQNPQPFLFDAADVNGDDVINVLDIIGIVDIILGKKKLVCQVIGTNTNLAYIYLDPDGIRFKSEGQVAAMQFELAGQNLEQIRLLMKQQGFEFASGVVNGKLMGILYNFQNRTIPEGMVNLISIEGRTCPLAWGDVVAGDPDGNYVLVLKDEPQPLPVEDYELKAFPNPFKESVTITYKLPEPATITLQFYNSQGQLIQSVENRKNPAGSHKLEWNGKGVPAGIYYCRLLGITKQGKEIKSEIKMVLIK